MTDLQDKVYGFIGVVLMGCFFGYVIGGMI